MNSTEVFVSSLLIAKGAIASSLLLGGTSKLFALPAFRLTLLQIPHIRARLATLLTYLIPFAEIGTAFGMAIGWMPAQIACNILFISFIGATILVLASGRQVSCACYGALSERSFSGAMLLETSLLLGVSLVTNYVGTMSLPYSCAVIGATIVMMLFVVKAIFEVEATVRRGLAYRRSF